MSMLSSDLYFGILRGGVNHWNNWRAQHQEQKPYLGGLNLNHADLNPQFDENRRALRFIGANFSGINFSECYLSRINLQHATLVAANFSGADLRDADLSSSYLVGANLSNTDLSGANLKHTTLLNTNLSGATLDGTDFSQSDMGGTILADVDLENALGLESVVHEGPSSIGIDSVYRSGGNIPDPFLRGAGVPDGFISYMASLVGKPLDFFTCFISYSHHDQKFCDRLYADLRAKGIRTWYFPEDAVMGRSVWGQIDRSIKVYNKLIVVCSEHSLQSRPVIREIERALQREDNEGGDVLFPIRIDNYLFHEWEHERKADVVAKVVGDFRLHESMAAYIREFDRLLRGLKASEADPL